MELRGQGNLTKGILMNKDSRAKDFVSREGERERERETMKQEHLLLCK